MAFWNKHSDGNWGRVPPLRVGEVVRVRPVAGDDGGGTWQARVREVGAHRITLDVDGLLPAHVPLRLCFERGDALYHFETQTLGPARRGMATLSFPRRVVRVQRREWYRLFLESPTTLRLLNADGRGTETPLPARLVNLSGGGALLSLGENLSHGALVSVRVPLGKDGSPQRIEARVLDCRASGPRSFQVRLRWTDTLDSDDREAIIAFLHEQQRMMLRARKLLRT